MRTRLVLDSILALGLFGLSALGARPALAASCNSDAECVKGWSCQVTGGSSCGSACAPGEDCGTPPPCTDEVYKSCEPGPCHADSDCADGMVCYAYTEADCAPTACASNDPSCPAPSCETKTESACVPRYLLPCTAAADCGSGFTCAQDQASCLCSGDSAGGGTPSSDGGAPFPAVPNPAPDCTCEPSDTSHCAVVPVTCAANTDCIAGWTCEAIASSTDCAGPTPPPNAGGDAGAPVPQPCAPSVVVKQCAPPYAALVGGSRGVSADLGVSTPSKGGSGENSGTGTPTAASDDAGAASSTAGCSVAFGSRAGSASALLFALGLLGVSRRRRAARAVR